MVRKKVIVLVLTVSCAIFFHLLLNSQRHRLRFDYLTLEHGLSQNSVYSICQDSKGFMWFGTEDGLNRYDGYNVTVYRTVPGNPHSLRGSVVYSICEDQNKNLWIGTYGGGLNKFNRETGTFTHYLHNPSMPGSLGGISITIIHPSRKQPGLLWLGTLEGGLNKFDSRTGQFTRYRFNPSDPHSLSHDTINAIHEDRGGNLWIGCKSGGLHKYDPLKENFIKYRAEPRAPADSPFNYISAICEDREGKLWIGSEGGLHHFDSTAGKFIPFHPKPGKESRLSSQSIRALHMDSGGILWIGTLGGGLNGFDPKTNRFRHYRADPLDPGCLSDNDIWSIYEDQAGVLWIGTEGGGINKLDLKRKSFVHYRVNRDATQSLSHNDVWAICEPPEDPGTVWIGTRGGGLNKLDRETETFTHYRSDPGNPNSLNNDSIFAMCRGPEGRLWLGTDGGGLNMFDPRGETFDHYTHKGDDPNSPGSNFIWAVCSDGSGFLWVGADGGGLNRFDPRTKIFTRYFPHPGKQDSLSSHNIWSLHLAPNGTLWVGTDNGLNRYHRETGTFTRYRHIPKDPGSLNNNRILCIYAGTGGILWVGTQGGGLNRLEPEKGTFRHYMEKDGLANNVIYGILEEKSTPPGTHSCLWLSTNKGLSRFNPHTGTFRNYNKSDGLQSDEFNAGACWLNQKGEMYFGGINGINVFQPRDIRDNPHIPPVVITGFQLFNRSVEPGKAVYGRVILDKSITEAEQITLSYNEDVFSIQFAALHYAAPEENRFSYRMEGLEKEWNEAGDRRFVTYTHLPPGGYVFRVKASNCDGIWNEAGTSLKITIIPPLWQTWWVKALLAVIIGTLIFLAYWKRGWNIRTNKRKLELLVDQRTSQLKTKTDELEILNEEKNKLLEELRAANKKLEKMSRIDGLTRIPNRRFFDETLQVEWKRCQRRGSSISLLMVDVDYFKLYNDTYGHQEGDECLKLVGASLSLCISRAGDLAARYGGEEFSAIMVDADMEGATTKAEEIRAKVQKLKIPHEKSDICAVVTISVGVASIVPEDEKGCHKLIEAADSALYKAKHSGRNRVCTSQK